MKKPSAQNAFTLIELLVVIAVIALLMAILVPALQRARRQAASINCLANVKTLGTGWYMYAMDNNGQIMSCLMDAKTPKGTLFGWIGTPRTANSTMCTTTQTAPAVTDEDEIRGIMAGVLYRYAPNPKSYHCPSDTIRISKHDHSKVFVSYEIPACLSDPTKAITPGQITRLDQIRKPSEKYCFVESAECRNFNSAGRFPMGVPSNTHDLAAWQWWGPMAVNHGDSSTLGFCDGHAERHKWVDKYTLTRWDEILRQADDNYGKDSPPAGQRTDIEYIARGWPYEDR